MLPVREIRRELPSAGGWELCCVDFVGKSMWKTNPVLGSAVSDHVSSSMLGEQIQFNGFSASKVGQQCHAK